MSLAGAWHQNRTTCSEILREFCRGGRADHFRYWRIKREGQKQNISRSLQFECNRLRNVRVILDSSIRPHHWRPSPPSAEPCTRQVGTALPEIQAPISDFGMRSPALNRRSLCKGAARVQPAPCRPARWTACIRSHSHSGGIPDDTDLGLWQSPTNIFRRKLIGYLAAVLHRHPTSVPRIEQTVDRHPAPIDRLDRRIDMPQRAAAATVPPGGQRAGRRDCRCSPPRHRPDPSASIGQSRPRGPGRSASDLQRSSVVLEPSWAIAGLEGTAARPILRNRHIDRPFDRTHLICEIDWLRRALGNDDLCEDARLSAGRRWRRSRHHRDARVAGINRTCHEPSSSATRHHTKVASGSGSRARIRDWALNSSVVNDHEATRRHLVIQCIRALSIVLPYMSPSRRKA